MTKQEVKQEIEEMQKEYIEKIASFLEEEESNKEKLNNIDWTLYYYKKKINKLYIKLYDLNQEEVN